MYTKGSKFNILDFKMKKLVLTIGLLMVSATSFALGCGNLGVKVINATNQECVLRSKNVFYGLPAAGMIPSTIAPGTTSEEFFMQQDYTGVGIQLGYQCGDKRVKFYSAQGYCGFVAGEVVGYIDAWNELSATVASIEEGSYWASTPGRITWLLHG